MIDRRHFSIVIIAFRLFLACYAAISTELVEEWGCYDSEFKLTCNDIDSHVGILEATFTPHCEGNQNCLVYDEDSIMKIIAQSLSRRAETHQEEAAARKLLDAIRNAKLKEREREENAAKTSEFRSELPVTSSSTDLYDPSDMVENITGEYESLLGRGDKRFVRDSLEKLINLYLTKLREDSDEYGSYYEDSSHDRKKRDLIMTNNGLARRSRRKKLVPGKCKLMRRRIGTLDRIEIEQALRNFTNQEFNIRKFLNYRCSGKNHCSFIFSTDHPYGIFWDEGTVHIKYICMDNFRVNKYCGELLQIGNEDWDLRSNINWKEIAKSHDDVENIDDGSGEGMFNGPRTEALRHNEMNYYKVTNLKIIKADDTNKSIATAVPQGKNLSEIKLMKSDGGKDKAKSKVFSQDFRILKVLPSVVEKPEPDIIEKLKKEEHIFHHPKHEDELTSSGNEIESNEIDSTLKTPTTFEKILTTGIIKPTIEISTTDNDQKITTTVEGIEKEIKDFEKTVVTTMLANDSFYDDPINNEVVPAIFDSPARKIYGDDIDYDTSSSPDESFEYDDSEEKEDDKRRGNHTSHQHTLPSSTLLHGFIANPGYPSYYIGNDKECKWRIKMAKGQKMMLTILDLHLRIDEFCKDSLEIIDTESKNILWKGCSELTRLVQVPSLSHQVEIVLKTKSKNIFPKRGFLIHYKAIGCIDPQLPANVKLVSRSENLLKFACEPEHVFPDTTHNEKSILCNKESWNETISQCVPLQETLGRQINLVNEKYRAVKMTSDSDMSDILVPVCIIAGLFVLNTIIFVIILRYRKQRRDDNFDRELADL